jgi:hypothetical protein
VVDGLFSLLPLGEGLGKRGVATDGHEPQALSPTLFQRKRELKRQITNLKFMEHVE